MSSKVLKQWRYQLPIYFGICLIISYPVISAVWNVLYTPSGFPSGVDVAFHTFFILKIIKTQNPLIPYTGFPEVKGSFYGYYCSLFHVIISGLTYVIAGGNVSFSSALNTIRVFMFATYIIGLLGYALLLRTIIGSVLYYRFGIEKQSLRDPKYFLVYYGSLILAFGLFIYSNSPIIKTINDGSYPNVFAMWCVLPIYLYVLLQKRWIIAGLLLAVIASTHNLSFVMALAPTISYFLFSSILSRENLKKSWVFLITFILFSVPALIFFYIPTATAAVNGTNPGLGFAWTRADIMTQITDYLYYAGIIASISILLINVKFLGWLSGWAFAYFPVALSSNVYNVRFGRDLSLPFGLIVGICAAIMVYKIIIERYGDLNKFKYLFENYKEKAHWLEKKQMIAALAIILITLAISYGYFADYIKSSSNHSLLAFDSAAMIQSNKYFLNTPTETGSRSNQANTDNNIDKATIGNQTTILVFGQNPWLKPMVYGKFNVLTLVSEGNAKYLSKLDKNINDRLLEILNNPNSQQAWRIIKEYHIGYIYLSDFLPNRFYSSSDLSEKSKFDRFQAVASHSNYIHLEKYFIGEEGEQLRIYSLHYEALNNNLETSTQHGIQTDPNFTFHGTNIHP